MTATVLIILSVAIAGSTRAEEPFNPRDYYDWKICMCYHPKYMWVRGCQVPSETKGRYYDWEIFNTPFVTHVEFPNTLLH
jgi:hypothetical protein